MLSDGYELLNVIKYLRFFRSWMLLSRLHPTREWVGAQVWAGRIGLLGGGLSNRCD